MKRGFLVAALAATVLLTACGSKKLPSDKAISCGEQAIEVGQSYLDGDMSYEEADRKLDDLVEKMDYVNDDSDFDENEHHSKDFAVQADIESLSHDLLFDNINQTSDSYSDVKEQIKNLKKDIGE